MTWLTLVEQDRETATRDLRCRVCKAGPGKPCVGTKRRTRFTAGTFEMEISHTGRYRAAAKRSLVPALPGES